MLARFVACRALNQAVGRCIRHRLDYGAIVLVDERFSSPRNQGQLSRWYADSILLHHVLRSLYATRPSA